MTDQTNKLDPCPFCGGQARVKQGKTVMVSCAQCSASTFQIIDDRGSAIAAWNRRASAPTAGSVPSDLTADHIDRFEASLSDLGPATRAAASLVCALAKSALLAQYGSPARCGVPEAVLRAVKRMSQPLDPSRLSGATAMADAADMNTIAAFINSLTAPQEGK